LSTPKEKTVRLAQFISEYLNSQGIDVWLEYGSALGAVREGGIIEGDHDIDMAIWWKDWEKFKDIVVNTDSLVTFIGYAWDFRTFPIFNYEQFPKGGEMCKIRLDEGALGTEEFSLPSTASTKEIDIYGFQEFDGIKCASAHLGPHTKNKSKLYHHKNLKKIKFEGLEFSVSAYVEKYLDYRYKDAAGTGNTWRTPLTSVEMEEHHSMEGSIPSYSKEDKVTACVIGVFDLFHIGHLRLLERSSKIFDKVVAAVHLDDVVQKYKNKTPVIPYKHRVEMIKACKFVDDVIEAPLPDHMEGNQLSGVEFLNNNDLDYMVHSYAAQEFLDYHYASIIKEHRLFLLEETSDYHTDDLIKRILK
jgi:cytidyltransferase-like protein